MKEALQKFIEFIQWTWKAVGAGFTAAIAFLYAQGAVDTSLNPIDALTDGISQIGGWSLAQWIALIGVILAAYGITFAVPNKPSTQPPTLEG